ncbi:MAG TPA: ankyrin repeat domain-containing protein [Gemmatimonadales bacterium]|nr:ankyrin repeat domain-containing protein [Gemmatimonadales bacterium]
MTAPQSLPESPSLEWLRKQAKRRLAELREHDPAAQLADAQFELAKQYGFPSWRALKARIESLPLDGQLFAAAKAGDLATLRTLLERHPDKLGVRNLPHEHSLLHVAAFAGQLAVVDFLLVQGLDVNLREKGDNTSAMHWTAAAGHLEVVRRLIAAGGDVTGHGDDHALEVIGWASCWEGCDDEAHRAIVDLLLRSGAKHHLFSAIATRNGAEVRRIVREDPGALAHTLSRNEDFQRPLHFAVRMRLPDMVALLLELGADPLGKDGTGYPPAAYAMTPGSDRPVSEAIRAAGRLDLFTALALEDYAAAERLLPGPPDAGTLHLMAKRGNLGAVRWLLARGADPNLRWSHWGALVTPLHLAALGNHPEVARALLAAGADPSIRDSLHDSDALGWATFFRRDELIAVLRGAG